MKRSSRISRKPSNRAVTHRGPQSVRLTFALPRGEPGHQACSMARFTPRRRHLRLGTTEETESGFRRSHTVARPGHRGVHIRVPSDRRLAATAVAGREPERLYAVSRQGIDPGGNYRISESSEYPLFRQMQAAVENEAELMAISYADRTDLTYGADEEMEKAYLQYVSGGMFRSFGLQPVAGRLLTENDDMTPGAHPYAVLSHDYWTRRFGRDQKVLGRVFRMGNDFMRSSVSPRKASPELSPVPWSTYSFPR